MARYLPSVLLGILLVVPLAQGLPEVVLEGDLRWNEPSTVQGILAPGPGSATLGLEPAYQGSPIPRLLTAPRAHLTLHRWIMLGAAHVGQLPSLILEPPAREVPARAEDLAIQWIDPVGSASMLVRSAGPEGLGLQVSKCALEVPTEDDAITYPARNAFPEGGDWQRTSPSPDDLKALCQAGRLDAASARSVLFFGMRLRLTGDGMDQTVWTGSQAIPEAVLPGTSRAADDGMGYYRAVQILEVRFQDVPMSLSLEAPMDVELYADEFVASGNLAMGQAFGHLVWGPQRTTGAVDPVQADGVFGFRRADGDRARIEGRTFEGPGTLTVGATHGLPPGLLIGGAALSAAILVVTWILFSRLTPADVLAHPRRQRIIQIVQEQPGIDTNTVARALGLTWAKVTYHVARLEGHGHVVRRRVGGRTALFAGGAHRGREAAVVLLRRPSYRRIHELLTGQPGMSQLQLAQALDLDRAHVSRLLGAMRRAGLVDLEEGTMPVRFHVRAAEVLTLRTSAPTEDSTQ